MFVASMERLAASICRESFFEFVKEFWDIVIPEEPIWNWHIKFICDEMQAVAERVFRGEEKEYDLVINVPPGSTKSTICSIMFPAWTWTRMPIARSICGSYSHLLSLNLSRASRDVVQSDRYRAYFHDLELREDQNTKGHFVNNKGGYRYSTSVGGTVMGFHGHFIIIDDPLDPQEALSEADLETANNWMTKTLPTRKVDKKVSVTVLIMQRLHTEDPTGIMLKQAKERKGVNVRHLCLPSDISEKNAKDVRPRTMRRYYTEDGLLDPVRMPWSSLNEARSKLLDYGYAGQFHQRPTPLEGGMFKVDRIITKVPCKPWIAKCRFWDKAGTEGGGAYTVGLLMGLDADNLVWILDVIRVQWDTGEREELIKLTADQDGPDVMIGVEQEPGSGGKESAQRTASNLIGYVVEIVHPTGDKKVRAMPFSSQVNSGRVFMAPGPWNDDYKEELKLFDKGPFKDQVDASSGAFTVLTAPGPKVGAI